MDMGLVIPPCPDLIFLDMDRLMITGLVIVLDRLY